MGSLDRLDMGMERGNKEKIQRPCPGFALSHVNDGIAIS